MGIKVKYSIAKPVTTELRLQIPSGYYGKIYPRSSLLPYNFVTIDGGVVDSDYRAIVLVLMINHGEKEFEVDKGERVAQVVIQKMRRSQFQKGSLTRRYYEGYGWF